MCCRKGYEFLNKANSWERLFFMAIELSVVTDNFSVAINDSPIYSWRKKAMAMPVCGAGKHRKARTFSSSPHLLCIQYAVVTKYPRQIDNDQASVVKRKYISRSERLFKATSKLSALLSIRFCLLLWLGTVRLLLAKKEHMLKWPMIDRMKRLGSLQSPLYWCFRKTSIADAQQWCL